MAEKYGFFDSTPEDKREYNMKEFAEYFARVLTNGIFNGGTNLQVTCTGSDINSVLNPGYAWINGYMYRNDSDLPLAHDLPDSVSDRIDRIVLRLDLSLTGRYLRAFVLKGTPADEPVAPELTRNETVWEISLAQVRIIHGKSFIEAAQIADERLNQDVCGLVNSLVTVDTAAMQAQFDAFMAEIGTSGGFVTSTSFNAHLADYVRQPGYGVTAGGTTTYTLTLNPAPTAYLDGMGIAIKINAANTGASTINVNGLGAKALKDNLGNDFAAGALALNTIYSFIYNATSGNFILRGKGGGSVKSVQHSTGIIYNASVYTDITIAAVDLTKAIVQVEWGNMNSNNQYGLIKVQFVNSTTVRVSRHLAGGTSDIYFSIEVIEFNNVKSLQKGLVNFAGSTNYVTINFSAVDMSKAFKFWSMNEVDGDTSPASCSARMEWGGGGNSITWYSPGGGNRAFDIAWQVIEFY